MNARDVVMEALVRMEVGAKRGSRAMMVRMGEVLGSVLAIGVINISAVVNCSIRLGLKQWCSLSRRH